MRRTKKSASEDALFRCHVAASSRTGGVAEIQVTPSHPLPRLLLSLSASLSHSASLCLSLSLPLSSFLILSFLLSLSPARQ
jgi:hypothetical protein